jgi:HNH endonuclease
MTSQQRQAVRERFGFRCGYCGVHEHQVGAELAIDHFQPRSRGGTDELDNLVYCCHACNSHKGDYWQPGTARRLLHPLLDNLAEHLSSSDDGTLRGLTETGTFHIRRLRLNRAALVARRQRLRRHEDARIAQQELLARISEVEQQVAALRVDIGALRSGAPDDAS